MHTGNIEALAISSWTKSGIQPSSILFDDELFDVLLPHAGAVPSQTQGTAASVPQDRLLQLLNAAVYSSPQDPQQKTAKEQLASLAPHAQALPSLSNAAAQFSTRLVTPACVGKIACF